MDNTSAKISFFGAAKGVTGSSYLLEVRGKKILIDCGLFQGLEHEKNLLPFPCQLKDISYLILTHAHVDHCGRIPCLVREGFKGKVVGTKPTLQLAKIMLLDAAKVMREHYKTLYKKSKRKGLEPPLPPLYDEFDVVESFKYFQVETSYDKPIILSQERLKITFKDAGHILGSSFLEVEDLETKKRSFSLATLGIKISPL
jgi:metallo-beta-lactamase family protein